MPELDIQDDSQAIVVGDFRLTFRWSGDRWTHELEHRGPRDPRHLAWSFETAPEHEEPTRVVSPAFQQLSFQEDGDKMQALLVGQAGPHHFSAVFEVEEKSDRLAGGEAIGTSEKHVTIKVDVADRCRAPVSALASTYRVAADPGELNEEETPDGFRMVFRGFGPSRLEIVAHDPSTALLAEDGRRATRAQVLASVLAGQSTHRWSYSLIWWPESRG